MIENKAGYTTLRVECAAIRTNEGQVFSVDRPGRHFDVIKLIRDSGYTGPIGGKRQGFTLNNGRFVMRKSAVVPRHLPSIVDSLPQFAGLHPYG